MYSFINPFILQRRYYEFLRRRTAMRWLLSVWSEGPPPKKQKQDDDSYRRAIVAFMDERRGFRRRFLIWFGVIVLSWAAFIALIVFGCLFAPEGEVNKTRETVCIRMLASAAVCIAGALLLRIPADIVSDEDHRKNFAHVVYCSFFGIVYTACWWTFPMIFPGQTFWG